MKSRFASFYGIIEKLIYGIIAKNFALLGRLIFWSIHFGSKIWPNFHTFEFMAHNFTEVFIFMNLR